jgi:hypothetical protein
MKRLLLSIAFVISSATACTGGYSGQNATDSSVGAARSDITIRYRHLDRDPHCHDIEVFGIAGTSCSNY